MFKDLYIKTKLKHNSKMDDLWNKKNKVSHYCYNYNCNCYFFKPEVAGLRPPAAWVPTASFQSVTLHCWSVATSRTATFYCRWQPPSTASCQPAPPVTTHTHRQDTRIIMKLRAYFGTETMYTVIVFVFVTIIITTNCNTTRLFLAAYQDLTRNGC